MPTNSRTMYFGEFPLSFAVCTNQTDMVRLLLAKKANLNAQDTNGNTALHLCVIHENIEMLKMLLGCGAKMKMLNKQNLSPLTLAAKLAKKKIFDIFLDLDCEKIWIYGESECISYPLGKIDTVDPVTGHMNEECALSLIVYGETSAHLDLLDGLIEAILDEKWKAYGRKYWIASLLMYIVYYAAFVGAYMLRPVSATTEQITQGLISGWGENRQSVRSDIYAHGNYTWNVKETQCHLLEYYRWPWYHGTARLVCEAVVVAMVLMQIAFDVRDIKRIGRKKWFRFMKAFPAKMLYKLSWFTVICMIPFRFACSISSFFLVIENVFACAAVILTTLHMLYFLRAIPFVGPFVLMIYTIIATDLLRFFSIYPIFLVGFSQAFYLIFNTCEREAKIYEKQWGKRSEFENVINNPFDSLLRTFIMTVGEFSVLYKELAACDATLIRVMGKIIFLIFEICVSILQFNMLIAMMTRTYETIFTTRKEWKRQWAQVILMLEMSLSSEERKHHHRKYTLPTGTNTLLRSYVVKKKGLFERSEEEELHRREAKAELMREQRKEYLRKAQKDQEMKMSAVKTIERLRRQSTSGGTQIRKALLKKQLTIR